MMKWIVGIHSKGTDPKDLKEIFEALGFRIVSSPTNREGEDFCVTNLKIDECPDSGCVWSKLEEVRSSFDVLTKSELELPLNFRLGVVYERHKSGWRCHIFGKIAESATLTDKMSATGTVTATNTVEAEKHRRLRNRKTITILWAIQNFPIVERVLSLLEGAPPAMTLGNIVDLIKDDMQGDLDSLTSKTMLKRFKRSINHPVVFGDNARHIVTNQNPPPNPMHGPEARCFVLQLVRDWIEYKNNSNSRPLDSTMEPTR